MLTDELDSVSIEKLIRIAYRCNLISDYDMAPKCIHLYQEGTVLLTGDPEEVRYYLRGLLRGRVPRLEEFEA